jgi:DNA-binding winged helix-turn-helix (wHTH) protein
VLGEMNDSTALKFGRFELQPRHRRLLRDGEPLSLGARAFDLLLALAERRDRVVTKAELLDLVWTGLVVEENNLQVQISALRRLLGAQTIATVPGRGYQFTAALAGAGSSSRQRLAAHGNLGLALSLSGNGDEALVSLEEALRLSPIAPFTFLWLYLLGFAKFLLGRDEEALALAERSLRDRPSFPGPHRIRAACLSQLGRIHETRRSIEQYLRLAPNATLRTLRAQVPLRRDADYERYANALRQAGMPE